MREAAARLDKRVSETFEISRTEARAVIKAGHVAVSGAVEFKPAARPEADADISVNGGLRPFVSRGGEKLEAAVKHFQINLERKTCLDIGASTGGFTDCMLKYGAERVFAIENGKNQLSVKLLNNPRVTLYEKTDIRGVKPGFLARPAQFAAVDVSFISLTYVLEAVTALLENGAGMVCLVKPQFEAGPGRVDKRGVIRGEAVHRAVIEKVEHCARGLGLSPQGVIPSPAASANKEFLMYLLYKKGA